MSQPVLHEDQSDCVELVYMPIPSNALQCVAVCCSVLQCAALQHTATHTRLFHTIALVHTCIYICMVYTRIKAIVRNRFVCPFHQNLKYNSVSMPSQLSLEHGFSTFLSCPLGIHLSHSNTLQHTAPCLYGVASISRIHKITGLFCKRAL